MNPVSAVEKVGEKILHGVEAPFKFIVRAERVLETAIHDQPELKSTLTTLVQKCENIGVDAMRNVGERGLDLSDDLKTAEAIADLGLFISSTLVPLVERLYGEIKTDVLNVEV
jgi:hypothetical protein